jgi:hypothetical protein
LDFVRHVVVGAGILVLVGLGACGKSHDSGAVVKLQWVEHADPVADATKALAQSDHRLLGVYGITLVLPGTDSAAGPTYAALYGLRPIEGTSDAIESPRHAQLVQEATDYAARYNSYVLAHARL